MEALCKLVFDELKIHSKNKHILFSCAALPHALGDYALIKQVITNILSNAIKFSEIREIPEIKITATERGNEIEFAISDNGVGFDMKYAHKLMGVFQRLHSAREFEGTGVGLAIVHRIITKHGGKVWGEGLVNEGATFYFTL